MDTIYKRSGWRQANTNTHIIFIQKNNYAMPHLEWELPDSDIPMSLYFESYGPEDGQPIVLIHGWPLSHRAWEPQMQVLADAGYRVIAYDRRGFGESGTPYEGYDYSSLAQDLHELIEGLELEEVILVGFSMGGGEVVRYFTDHGSDFISKAVLMSSIIPLVPQKDDNPDGVPQKDLKGIMQQLEKDRVAFMKQFARDFYNADDNEVSEEQLHYTWNIAAHASPRATLQAAKAWAETDFREECANVDVPTLIIHGDADNIVPIQTAGDQAAELIPDNTYHVIKGGPHGLNLTHRDEVNALLLDFLKG